MAGYIFVSNIIGSSIIGVIFFQCGLALWLAIKGNKFYTSLFSADSLHIFLNVNNRQEGRKAWEEEEQEKGGVEGTSIAVGGKHGTHQIIIDIIYFFNISFGLYNSKEQENKSRKKFKP